MEITRQCSLCVHKVQDFKTGALCGLTQKKPDFINTCPKIMFGEKLFIELEQSNLELENFKRKKLINYLHFITFILISIFIFLITYYIKDFFVWKGNISTVFTFGIPIIMIAVGVYTTSIAFGYLNKYRNDLSIATDKKSQLDSILKKYNLNYHIDLEFGKKYLGNQDVRVNINFDHTKLLENDEKDRYPRTVRISNL